MTGQIINFPDAEIGAGEVQGYIEDIAADHVRKGWYDDGDLKTLGITRAQAERYQRQRRVSLLANQYRNDPGVLRDALTLIEADHFHVFAVQDWGGSQEARLGCDDQLTRQEAEQLAADMADADTLCWTHGDWGAAERKYGERLYDGDLISDNVAPGWSAIWVMPCGAECRFRETFHRQGPEEWIEPYWTPSPVVSDVESPF